MNKPSFYSAFFILENNNLVQQNFGISLYYGKERKKTFNLRKYLS